MIPPNLLCKNPGRVAPPPENFSARETPSNVQNRAFWKPLPEIFLKYFLMSINIHRSPRETCQRHLLSAAPYCPLPLYVKIEAKWKHFMEISYQADFWREPRCCKGVIIGDHRGSSPLLLTPPLNGENRRFWKHLWKIFRKKFSKPKTNENPADHANFTSCQWLHIARYPSM